MPQSIDKVEDWIGSGVQFAHSFNPDSGRVIANKGADRLHQSIYIILSTIKGERFFLPEFGSDLHKLVFEQNDYILKDLLQVYIKEALAKWEPRIVVTAVEVLSEQEGNTVPVSISYRIKKSNVTGNYVYPFERAARPLGGEV